MKRLSLKIAGILIIGIFLLQSSVAMAATKTELNNSKSETDKKREEEAEKSTGKNWVIMPGIVVFTALLAILLLRKREK